MSTGAVAALCAAVAGLLGLLVPAVIRRLPEPADPAPEEGEGESEWARILREEGPKTPYVDLAAAPRLAWISALVSAVVAAGFGLALGADRVLIGLVPLVPVGVLLAYVDARTRLLPRHVVLPATWTALLLLLVEWAVSQDTGVLLRAVVAMVVARSFFWILWFLRRAGMGFGDVRLAALVALALGRLGWDEWVVGMYGGLLVFAVFGIALAIAKRSRAVLKQALPYGPFMLLGLVLGVLTSGAVTIFS